MKKCVLCGKNITYTFWVCAECEELWGLDGVDYRNWPEWVKALVSIERRAQYVRENIDIIYTGDTQELENLLVEYERD